MNKTDNFLDICTWIIYVVLVIVYILLLLSGCTSDPICASGVTFGYDPNGANALCAYAPARGEVIACGLTPQEVAQRCGGQRTLDK